MKYQLQMLKIERYYKPNNSDINKKIKNITKKIIGYFYSEISQQVGDIIRYNEKDSTVKDYVIRKIIHITKQEHEVECVLEVEIYNNEKLYTHDPSIRLVEAIPLVIDIEKENIPTIKINLNNHPLSFIYKNWKGNIDKRTVLPIRLWYGSTVFYKEDRWLLKVIDTNIMEERDFAIKDIIEFL